MEWKLQHESHNRQDKTHNPDYREEFLAESRSKATQLHRESFKEILLYKAELIQRYAQASFVAEDRHLRLDWSLKQYAQFNNLESQVNRRFKAHRAAALQDLRAITEAIRSAEPFWGASKKGKQQPQVLLTVPLQCDCVIPSRTEDDTMEVKTIFRRAAHPSA